jgi:hypothetical protein
VDITNAINDNNPGWRIKDIDSRDISVSSHTILSGFRPQFGKPVRKGSKTFDTLLPSTSGFEPMLKSPMISDSSSPASIRHYFLPFPATVDNQKQSCPIVNNQVNTASGNNQINV